MKAAIKNRNRFNGLFEKSGRSLQWLCAALIALLLSPSALAGTPSPGSITFSPVATSVPTLGTIALLFLALLLGFIGWVSLRRQGPGGVSMLTVGSAVLALTAAGGVQWVERADAGGAAVISNTAGQTFSVDASIFNSYINNTSVPMRASSITLPASGCSTPTGTPQCVVGTVLANGETCDIDCTALVDSDRRLKEAVVRVGTTESGLGLYEYRYRSDYRVFRGVMAQEVLFHTPEAVHLRGDGFLTVDYAKLGLTLVRTR